VEEVDALVVRHMAAKVVTVAIAIGSAKPAQVLQEVLAIVARLVGFLAGTAEMVQMDRMAEMGMMEVLVA
jgi:hypothetical protein